MSATACSSALAQAQSAAPTPPAPGSPREMKFGVRVSGLYDSNLARSSSAVAATRGITREDYIVSPSATASIVQPIGRQVVFLQGSGGYDFHRYNERLDRQRYDITGGYAAAVGLCQPTITGTYRAQQSDLADIDQVLVENLQKATGVNVGVSCSRGLGPGVSVQAQRVDTKNSADSRKTSDTTTEGLNAGVNYKHATLGTLTLIYMYQNSEFPNRIIPGRPVGDGFWTQTYGAQVERNFGSRLKVNGQLSRTTVKREFAPPGQQLKFTATTYQGDVAYRFGQRIDFELHGRRSVKPSARVGKLYDVETSGDVVGRYQLGDRITLSAGYGILDTDSNADTSIPTPVVTNSKTNSTYGSVSYRQNERLSFNLNARRDDRETNLPAFDYKSTRIGLTAEFRY